MKKKWIVEAAKQACFASCQSSQQTTGIETGLVLMEKQTGGEQTVHRAGECVPKVKLKSGGREGFPVKCMRSSLPIWEITGPVYRLYVKIKIQKKKK